MQWTMGFVAIALLTGGLIAQAFEMRKIRLANPDQPGSPNVFLNKKNFKWYAIIAAGLILWFLAERN